MNAGANVVIRYWLSVICYQDTLLLALLISVAKGTVS